MSDQKSIKESLNIIRKALEEDEDNSSFENKNDILILNKLINEDGTIKVLDDNSIDEKEIKKYIDRYVSKYLDKNFEKWLNKNATNYLDKHYKNKL